MIIITNIAIEYCCICSQLHALSNGGQQLLATFCICRYDLCHCKCVNLVCVTFFARCEDLPALVAEFGNLLSWIIRWWHSVWHHQVLVSLKNPDYWVLSLRPSVIIALWEAEPFCLDSSPNSMPAFWTTWLVYSFPRIYSRGSVVRRIRNEHLTASLVRYPNRKAFIWWFWMLR